MTSAISVIMSTYNEEISWVKESVNSILTQTYQDFEFLIVLDNPGNVELQKLLIDFQREDPRIKVILNDTNLGLVQSLNLALRLCKGKYIARMDADDISREKRLEKQKSYLEENELDFVFSGMTIIDEFGERIYDGDLRELDYSKTKRLLPYFNLSTHPTWFLKRELYETLKGYRNIPYCEDYDFTLRCIKYGYKIGKMPSSLLMYRVRPNSISRSYRLEQYLITRQLSKSYRQNRLEGPLLDNIANCTKKIDFRSKKRYFDGDRMLDQGVKLIKNKRYLSGIFLLMKSLIKSKYLLIRGFDVLRYKSMRFFN